MKAVYFDGKKATVKKDYPEYAGKDVTVDVTLAGICGTDIEILGGYMRYVGVPGHEFVGTVKERGVSSRIAGMRVAGEINCGCHTCDMCRRGLQRHCSARTVLGILNRDGAFAERLSLPESNLHTIPDSVSDRQAVFIEPVAAALEILDQVAVSPDWRVAIVGDGRLAHLVCQVIKTYACAEDVTCFGRHIQKISTLQRFGVQTRIGIEETDMHKFDMVVEASGSTSGFADAASLVKPRGMLVLKSTLAAGTGADLTHAIINEVTLVGSRCGRFGPAINAIATGAISTDHMTDKTFTLDEFDAAIARAQEPDALKVYLRPST